MRYLFFDVDGVIIKGWNFSEGKRKLWYENIHNDFNIDYVAIRDFFNSNIFVDVLRGKYDLIDSIGHFFRHKDINIDATNFVRYWFEKDAFLDKPLLEWLSQIEGMKCLATIQEHHRASYLWNDLGLRSFFSEIFYSGSIGYLKDEPAFFHYINTFCNIKFEQDEVLYFDDNPNFVETATSCGWKAFCIERTEQIQHILNSISHKM